MSYEIDNKLMIQNLPKGIVGATLRSEELQLHAEDMFEIQDRFEAPTRSLQKQTREHEGLVK